MLLQEENKIHSDKIKESIEGNLYNLAITMDKETPTCTFAHAYHSCLHWSLR